jgi:hypothetical protein
MRRLMPPPPAAAASGQRLPPGQNVIVHRGLRARRVAGLDRRENRRVFGQRLLQTTVDAQRKQARQLEHLAQVLDHLPQPAVAGHFLDAQ